MPKRKRIQKFPSTEVQGEGSWVLAARITVAEIRENRKASKKKAADLFELTVNALKSHIYEWNWVDDNSEPLPQPKDDPSVIDGLAEFETVFLSKCISGSEADAKN